MSVNVKAIFPSKSKKKNKSSERSNAVLQSPTKTGFFPFRPLTPESQRKHFNAPSNNTQVGEVTARTPTPSCSPPQTPGTNEASQTYLENELSSQPPREIRDSHQQRNNKSNVNHGSRPNSSASLRHRESISSTGAIHDRSSSVNSEASYYADFIETPMIDQGDIIALTHHVRSFSDALSSLRNTFVEGEEIPDIDPRPPEVKAHERLGEVLSILKGVLNKYPPLHSTDILASAGTLINKVKSHKYDDTGEAPDEFYESIDQLALAFSSSVSDFLMGEQDLPLGGADNQSKYLDDFGDDEDDLNGLTEEDEKGYDEDVEDDQEQLEERREHVDTSVEKADELDKEVISLENGVNIAMGRTKVWSKYAKDLASYVERRSHLELEYTNKLARLAQGTRSLIAEESYLPFQSIFITALEQDIEYANTCGKTCDALMGSRFMEPLNSRRNSHDLRRKELKNLWAKSCKKLKESLDNLEKARRVYVQRKQELEKLSVKGDSKEEQAGALSFGSTKKKKEGSIHYKAEEAEEVYRACVDETNRRQKQLQNVKRTVLVELRQMVYQCDMTMKAVTCNYFQLMNAMASSAPVQYQTLAESSRLYEPGAQFAEFVRVQKAHSLLAKERVYTFEPYYPGDRVHPSPQRHNSYIDPRNHAESELKATSPFTTRRNKSLQVNQVNRAWKDNHTHSDEGSTGSRSLPASPSGSPVAGRKKLKRTNSLPMASSDEDSDKDSDDKGVAQKGRRKEKKGRSADHFRNSLLSAAAKTHSLRKLRSPSRCRECDSYVYFNGAECALCGISCHRKCLGQLSITCSGLQRLPRRMTTFGVDFQSHLEATDKLHENIPQIVSSCIAEIDDRGLTVKGLYRVSGVKSRVEKLCQAFESGADCADLSDVPPHVIAAVLKLYLRQLPEPLLTFKLYPKFIEVAKESFVAINNHITCKKASEDEETSSEYRKIIQRLREVVVQLPRPNFVTAAKLMAHLHQVSANEDQNQMSASNLGIVFGPTLLRPSEQTSSLSALVDMPYQTRTVELLVTSPHVFDSPNHSDPAAQDTPIQEFTPPPDVSSKHANEDPSDLHSVRPRIGNKGQSSSPTLPLHQSLPSLPSAPFYAHDLDDSSSSFDFSSLNSSLRASHSFIHDSSGLSSPANSTPSAPSPALLLENDTADKHLPDSLHNVPTMQDASEVTSSSSEVKSPASASSTLSTSSAPSASQRTPLDSTLIPPAVGQSDPALLAPSTAHSPKRASLGFGTEFFELLDRSNNRKEEVEGELFDVPEFLLPGSTPYERPGHESDDEGLDVDTTQGTRYSSSSHTPDDELNSLDEKSKSPTHDRSRDESQHANTSGSDYTPANRSRCASEFSATASFCSIDNVESMLPDLSDQKRSSGSPRSPKSPSSPKSPRSPTSPIGKNQTDFSQTPEEIARRQRFLDDTEVYFGSYARRPRGAVQASRLGLVKRNSDLPVRMSQNSGLSKSEISPLSSGMKSSSSETDVRLTSLHQVSENSSKLSHETTPDLEVREFLGKMPEVLDFLGTPVCRFENLSGEESEKDQPFNQESDSREGKRKITVVLNEEPSVVNSKAEGEDGIAALKRKDKSLEMEAMGDLKETIIDEPYNESEEQRTKVTSGNRSASHSRGESGSTPPVSPGKEKPPIRARKPMTTSPLTSPVKTEHEFRFDEKQSTSKTVDQIMEADDEKQGPKCPLATPESSYSDFEQVENPMALNNATKHSQNQGLFVAIDSAILDRKLSDAGESTDDILTSKTVSPSLVTSNIAVTMRDKPREKDEFLRATAGQHRSRSGSKTDSDSEIKHGKPKLIKTSSSGKVSVKDRRKHFEQKTTTSESPPKAAASVHINLASRKQVFEQGRDRAPLYKRSSELTSRRIKSELDNETVKLRHERESDDVDGPVNTQSTLSRPKASSLADLTTLDFSPVVESTVKLRPKRPGASERPRSLILERLRLDRMEPLKDMHKTDNDLANLEPDKTHLVKRDIDISSETESQVRTSPRTTKRSSLFLEDDKTDREPQFV